MSENFPYHSTELAREAWPTESRNVGQLLELLHSPELRERVDGGYVTFAMVRPNVGPSANILGLPDSEAAEKIEEMIEGLGVMAKFSFHFTRQVAEEFYDGARQSMLGNDPRDRRYPTRWEEFSDFMSSGPVTGLLLEDSEGRAIETWRAQLGHWNIDKYRDPETIRGKLGVNIYNNLVHGSDSPEAVHRELHMVMSLLEQEGRNEYAPHA